MDDRELIARAIGDKPWRHYNGYEKQRLLEQADAVLAALDGRIVPELPGNVTRIDLSRGESIDSPWTADLEVTFWDDGGDDYYTREAGDGIGPTIAAAIRAALEETGVEGDDAK